MGAADAAVDEEVEGLGEGERERDNGGESGIIR